MTAPPDVTIPPAHSFAWNVVLALRELDGSGGIGEINERVTFLAGLSEDQQSVPRGQGRTEVEYRLAWARTLVKNLDLVENSARGVWTLTRRGWEVSEEQVEQRKQALYQATREARRTARHQTAGGASTSDDDLGAQHSPDEDDGSPGHSTKEFDVDDEPFSAVESLEAQEPQWRAELLAVLKEMDPAGFERLCQRLLREAGFADVRVIGGSRDGGIDGTGVYRVSLISFPVFFQAKRYAKTVSSSVVRDFRGAMAGRGDRGLLITTGAFTTDARAEATRDGAPPVDLIDGDALAELLREYSIGVTSTLRTVEDVTVDATYFAQL